MDNTSIIILAAGASSRMGQSKQLLKIGDKSLLQISIEAALHSKANSVLVVLGANEAAHQPVVQKSGVASVIHPDWQSGMGSSIKKGLSHLLAAYPSLESVVVLVCDQPLISPEHINKLLQGHQQTKKPVVASKYNGTTGVPVLFSKECFPLLLGLPDGQGAKKILQQHPEWVVPIDFPGGTVDLDTPEDYSGFVKVTNTIS